MKKIAAFFCTCIILFGCTSTPKVDTLAEANAIRNIEAQWATAIQGKDVNKIISFFASDAVSMPVNRPIIVGLESLRKDTEYWFSDTTILFKTYSNTVEAVEISSSGDLAYDRGTDHLVRNTSNGPVEDIGKWIGIYKKINGEWKCVVVIGNNDKP